NAFKMADEVLLQGVQGITDLITTPGLINTDFADVKMIMTNAGSSLMGIGYASGEGRALNAARAAISSPLLEASIEGARGILLNISGGSDLGLFEVNEAAEIIRGVAHPDANIIFGAVIDDTMGDGGAYVTEVAPDVQARRRAVVDAPWTWLRQVHGDTVVTVSRPGAEAGTKADAAVSAEAGCVLAVLAGDCAPVALVSPEGVVAVVHAGWRGLLGG